MSDHQPQNEPPIMPSVTERTPRGDVTMDVYTRLLRDRIIWLGTAIIPAVANVVMAQLLYLEHEDSNEDIYMYINSPGGAVESGLAIYDIMKFIECDIVTICVGSSHNIATVLLAAGTHGKRYAMPNSLIHQHSSSTRDIQGYTPDAEIQARQVLDTEAWLNKIMAQHTGQPIERIQEDFKRDKYFRPQEAVEYGLIDHVITRSRTLV